MVKLDTYIIAESIDEDNLFWKIDQWFNKKESEKLSFINLIKKFKDNNNTVDPQVLSDYLAASKFRLKAFVDFILDNIKGSDEIDYLYTMTRIINLIIANKSNEITL